MMVVDQDGKPVTTPTTSVGAFVIGKDGIVEKRIELYLNPEHKKYPSFFSQLQKLINDNKGTGLIPYMSGI